MNAYKSFAITVVGGSHIKHDKGCEDSSYHFDDSGMSIAVVADGHGDDNCFRSAKGSQLAVACAAKGIYDFVNIHESKFSSGLFGKKTLPLEEDFEKVLRDLVKHIIASWQVKVLENCTASPFTAEELAKADEKHRKRYETDKGNGNKAYGATLIASAITPYYWFGIHIGDGRLTALYPDGTFDQPVPWDEKCYLNVTTSICDDDAFERTRFYFAFNEKKAPPVAVFLCSDGIDDNYPVDENEKHLFKLYRTIALTFAEDGFDDTYKQMIDLVNSFATKGKGDDTSIAGFIDMKLLKQAVPIWRKQITEEEQVIEKAAAEETAQETAQTETEAEPEKPPTEKPKKTVSQKALEAIAAYGKQMSARGDISSYGEFVSPKPYKGKK